MYRNDSLRYLVNAVVVTYRKQARWQTRLSGIVIAYSVVNFLIVSTQTSSMTDSREVEIASAGEQLGIRLLDSEVSDHVRDSQNSIGLRAA